MTPGNAPAAASDDPANIHHLDAALNQFTETGVSPNPRTADSGKVDALLDRLRSRRLDKD